MISKNGVTRRGFVGGMAGAVGLMSLGSPKDALAAAAEAEARWQRRARTAEDPYDLLAKVNFNENPYGPTEPVLKAMTQAFKFANRYNAPDGDIVKEIAKLHGVKPENIVLAAGSGEILDVVGSAFAANGKTVVGV